MLKIKPLKIDTSDYITAAILNSECTFLVLGLECGLICGFDLERKVKTFNIIKHQSSINYIEFNYDCMFFITAGADTTIKIFN